jgi:hypothetical protein
MAANLSSGEGMLPVTGFGPGSIVVAGIGGFLTLFEALRRRLRREAIA